MFYPNRIFHSSLAFFYNIFLAGFAFFLLIALVSNNPNDPSLSVATGKAPSNIFGAIGSYSSDFLLQNFGVVAYFIPFLILGRAFFFSREIKKFSILGLVLIFLSLVSLCSIFSEFQPSINSSFNSYGGFLGMISSSVFLSFFKNYTLLWKILFFLGILMITIFYNFQNVSSLAQNKLDFLKKKINFFKTSKKFSHLNPRGKGEISKINNEPNYSSHIEIKDDRSLKKKSIFLRISDFFKKKIENFKKERKRRLIQKEIHIDHYTKPNILNSSEEFSFKGGKGGGVNQDLFSLKKNQSELINNSINNNDEIRQNEQNSFFKSDFFKNNGSFLPEETSNNNEISSESEALQNNENFFSLAAEDQGSKAIFENKPEQIVASKASNNDLFGRRDFSSSFEKNHNKVIQKEYKQPDLALLQDKNLQEAQKIDHESIRALSEKLIKVLEDFSIFGKIVDYFVGPVITLFEFEPLPGTKSSRVIGLSDDIARSLSAISTRISVIPGKNALGIELPNKTREIVLLKDLLITEEYQDANFSLPIALGKNIAGLPVIVDLSKMPHVLVAGTTGSGKSVAINIFILSILFKLKPEECRFIMIDPKMLELSVYNGIPHLLTPVVTDPKKAVLVLKWVVKEMENRYKMMSYLGVRNIQNYNQKIEEAINSGVELFKIINLGFDKGKGEPITEKITIEKKKFHYIVVIVDEMADLMLVAGKELEFYVQRIAQMARAAGIHIIMATQRPSVDVITGVIKANLPTRISFAVTNKIDSRTILGEQGAEQLLGMGDMLYMPSGGKIVRVHGPFVSDKTVENVVNYLHSVSPPQYVDEILQEIENNSLNSERHSGGGSSYDDFSDDSSSGADKEEMLYKQALRIVLKEKKTSISYIQRQLRIGYNKSANLIERMEKEGFLSAPNHQGKREVLKDESYDDAE